MERILEGEDKQWEYRTDEQGTREYRTDEQGMINEEIKGRTASPEQFNTEQTNMEK